MEADREAEEEERLQPCTEEEPQAHKSELLSSAPTGRKPHGPENPATCPERRRDGAETDSYQSLDQDLWGHPSHGTLMKI